MRLRTPSDIQQSIAQWPGYWAAMDLQPSGEVRIRYYDGGEASAVFTRRDANDYYLWSETRQVRLQNWKRADEMWEFVREVLNRGPDRYGLAQLPL